MCASTPDTPEAPTPLAAAPTMPSTIDRGTATKKKVSQFSATGSRGIYQPVNGGGKDLLGQ